MKNNHLFWGVLFLIIGSLIFIDNYTSLSLDWEFILNLWPVILIIIGISILIRNSQYKWILVMCSAIVVGMIFFSIYKNIFDFFDDDFDVNVSVENNLYEEEYKPEIKNANLYLDASAGMFKLEQTTDKLVSIETKSNGGSFTFQPDITDDKADIYFEQEEKHFNLGDGWLKNKVDIKLNINPVWDMDYEIGASKAELDLSPYKLDDVYFKSGASSIKLKLGDKQDSIHLKFDSGVSKLTLLFPKETGCLIDAQTELSNKNFRNFQKVDNHTYRSKNYYDAKKKLFVDLNADVSSIRVDTY